MRRGGERKGNALRTSVTATDVHRVRAYKPLAFRSCVVDLPSSGRAPRWVASIIARLGCRPGSGSPWLRWAAASDRAVQSIGFSPDLGPGSAGLSVGQRLGPYAVHRHLTLAVPARLGCCGFGVFVHVLLYRATSGALFVPLATFRSLGIFLYLVANTVHGPRRTHFDLRLLHLNSEFDASGRQVCGAGRSSSTHLSASIDRCNASAHAFALSVRTPPK
jgi:hypothetical protein